MQRLIWPLYDLMNFSLSVFPDSSRLTLSFYNWDDAVEVVAAEWHNFRKRILVIFVHKVNLIPNIKI